MNKISSAYHYHIVVLVSIYVKQAGILPQKMYATLLNNLLFTVFVELFDYSTYKPTFIPL